MIIYQLTRRNFIITLISFLENLLVWNIASLQVLSSAVLLCCAAKCHFTITNWVTSANWVSQLTKRYSFLHISGFWIGCFGFNYFARHHLLTRENCFVMYAFPWTSYVDIPNNKRYWVIRHEASYLFVITTWY